MRASKRNAARAVDAVQTLPQIDATRIAAYGRSQGGGIAIAAAGMHSGISVILSDVPFLCHYRRATQIQTRNPMPRSFAT
ncbi:MAG TPA: acetylxylan esterase [Candidatus Saccharimonadales bacterium]|nr:acetylxylan esterase [Candidatus Saccharimonadales bacterium]